MTCKVTLQKNSFAESLAIVGRAVGTHTHLPVLSNILLSKDQGQIRLSATNLTLCVTTWLDAQLDGDLALTLPAKTLTDVINSLSEPQVIIAANGKPEAAINCGTYKGTVKGIEASEYPEIPAFDISNGVSINANILKEMIRKVVFAASLDESRPVLNGVLVSMNERILTMVATDGFRLTHCTSELSTSLGKRQVLIPAVALKEVFRILTTTRVQQITLVLSPVGNQIVLHSENVQIVSQLIEGKYPEYQAIIPKSHKTRVIVPQVELIKACKQASIIAREGSNIVRFHLVPGMEKSGKMRLSAESDETGASEIELAATVEGQPLEIAFNVKYLLDGLEVLPGGDVIIETNAFNTPAKIRSDREEDYYYILMPMHID